MGKLDGKVAFITGAARGQGRSHAIRLAEEGADVIALDICDQIATVPYPGATKDDLDETVAAVRDLDRRIVAVVGDVRDAEGVRATVARGAAELGGLDIVVANAGILSMDSEDASDDQVFRDVLDVNLVGVWNTLHSTAPLMIEAGKGGAIVITSSTQGFSGRGGNGTGGLSGYVAAKHGVVGLMRSFATWLAPHNIRVNTVHPTGVASPMIVNEYVGTYLAEHPETANALANLMPVEMVESIDISHAIAWLVSDEARYVTGVMLPVDAGFSIK
jgi:SDR family mycofactocin-dependent oxidoreductase